MASSPEINRALKELSSGSVVAVPTDTVYGLAVVASLAGATDRLFAIKERPDEVALPVLVADTEAALQLCAPSARGQLLRIGDHLWPGALTLIVARDNMCTFDLGGDPMTIGLRVSGAEVLQELCRLAGPLAVSSANLHGRPPCTSASELRESFGQQICLVDGGHCNGQVSTVVDLTGPSPALRREGAIPFQQVLDLLG